MHGAGPGEGFGEELVDALDLGGFVFHAVAAFVVGLIPDVPAENSLVVGEGSDYSLDVGLELGLIGWIEETFFARALDPAGVVDAGDGGMLRAEMRIGLPAGIEEDEERT